MTTATARVELRPYQAEALEALDAAIEAGITRNVISQATGTGKTVEFASWLARRSPKRALVLVHRDELVQQAEETIRRVWADASVGVVKAERDEWDARCVVASVQTLRGQRLARYAPGTFEIVVIDECHHATAPSYRNIVDRLQPPLLLGVSATPFRHDRETLENVFDQIVFSFGLAEAIKAGYLTDIACYRVRSEAELDGVTTRAGDFAPGELEAAVNTRGRNALVVDAYQRLAGGRRAIVFAAGVGHARALMEAFRAEGVASAFVCADTPPSERREILSQLKDGTTPVVCNAMVLTEGFDAPAVEAVILARPTKSTGLFTQMVGRGTRPSPATGKERCILIDVADNTRRHRLVTVGDLVGVARPVDDGASLVAEALHEHEVFASALGRTCKSLRPDISVEEVEGLVLGFEDLMTPPIPDWREVGERLLELAELAEAGDLEWQRQFERAHCVDIDWSAPATPRQVNRLSSYGWPRDEAEALTKGSASAAIDITHRSVQSWAEARAKVWANLLGWDDATGITDAAWKCSPASERQVELLARNGIDGLGMTEGEASAMISWLTRQGRMRWRGKARK